MGLGLAACASGGPSGGTGGSTPLEIAAFSPFTGPNAPYGYFQYTGCVAAVHAINAAGGVMGHDLTCKIVDNRGEPADAITGGRVELHGPARDVAARGDIGAVFLGAAGDRKLAPEGAGEATAATERGEQATP